MKMEFENSAIEFNVLYGIRKKISIHIDTMGFITVKAPNDTSKEMLMSVVKQHGKRIMERLHIIMEARETIQKREYQDKGKFLSSCKKIVGNESKYIKHN